MGPSPHAVFCRHGKTFEFCLSKIRGVDGDAVRDAYYHQAVYQAHMRTSQRDPKSDAARKLIVMDKGTAEWARAIFPRAAVGLLGSGVAPPEGQAGAAPQVCRPGLT